MMAPSNAGTKHLERLFDPCVAKTLGLRFGKRSLRLGIARERPHAHAPQPARRADGSAERLGGRLRIGLARKGRDLHETDACCRGLRRGRCGRRLGRRRGGRRRLCTLRSEEHTSELQSLMRISYTVFRLQKTNHNITINKTMSHAVN